MDKRGHNCVTRRDTRVLLILNLRRPASFKLLCSQPYCTYFMRSYDQFYDDISLNFSVRPNGVLNDCHLKNK